MYDKLFNTYPNKFQIIAHQAGHCGALIYRILAHNPKYYWHEDLSAINSSQKRKDSLDWPDHDIGYMYDVNDGNGKNLEEQRLTTVHVQNPGYNTDPRTFRKLYVILKKSKYKIVCIRAHDLLVHETYPQVKVIRICGSFPERGDQYTNPKITLPVDKDNVINLQLENILSKDYKTFEKEYFELCEKLLINPTPIPVRGYILNYLDRLNNHKNKVIPRIK